MSDAWGLHIEEYERKIGRRLNPFGELPKAEKPPKSDEQGGDAERQKPDPPA